MYGTKLIALTRWGSAKCLIGMRLHQQRVNFDCSAAKLNASPQNIYRWYLGQGTQSIKEYHKSMYQTMTDVQERFHTETQSKLR